LEVRAEVLSSPLPQVSTHSHMPLSGKIRGGGHRGSGERTHISLHPHGPRSANCWKHTKSGHSREKTKPYRLLALKGTDMRLSYP